MTVNGKKMLVNICDRMLKMLCLIVLLSFFAASLSLAADSNSNGNTSTPDEIEVIDYSKYDGNKSGCLSAGGEYYMFGGYDGSTPVCYPPAPPVLSWQCGYPSDPQAFVKDMMGTCWFCKPVQKVIEVMQNAATTIYEAVNGGVTALFAVCFGIFLVFKIVNYIAVLKYRDVGDFYTDMGSAALKALIAVLLINMGNGLWNYTISPLASAVFDYGSLAMTLIPTATVSGNDFLITLGEKIIGNGDTAGGIMVLINQKLMSLIAIGWLMMSIAMQAGDACMPIEHIDLFIAGMPFVLLGIIFVLAIPLKFADLLFRLGVFLILMPMFIFAWAFPITKQFFKKGLNLLVNVMVNFLVLMLLIALCTELITSALNINISSNDMGMLINELQQKYVINISNIITTSAMLVFSFVVINQTSTLVNIISDTNFANSGFDKAAKNAPTQFVKSSFKLTMAVLTAGKAGVAFTAAKMKQENKDKKKKEAEEKDNEN